MDCPGYLLGERREEDPPVILLGICGDGSKRTKRSPEAAGKGRAMEGKRHMETERGVPFTEDYVKKCLYLGYEYRGRNAHCGG